MNYKHGHGKPPTPTYWSWQNMRDRCNNPANNRYEMYSAHGIKICERWNNFGNFLTDMGVRPDGKSIERINNDLGYSPENCRWATPIEQARNTRRTKLTIEKAREIVRLWKSGHTHQEIAITLNISKHLIGNVTRKTNRQWKEAHNEQ